MKRVLIYFPERQLAPKGGPAGYLNNLKNGLNIINHEGVEILFYSNAPVEFEENQILQSHVPKRLKEIRRAYKFANYLKRSLPVDKSLFNYDAIHFHKTEDMYLNRNMIKQYSGKVILTVIDTLRDSPLVIDLLIRICAAGDFRIKPDVPFRPGFNDPPIFWKPCSCFCIWSSVLFRKDSAT